MTNRYFELRILNGLEDRARLLRLTRGRVTLTPFEARVLTMEREYMRTCQTQAFRDTWGERYAVREYVMTWQPASGEDDFVENKIDERRRNGWIARRLNVLISTVSAALARVTQVYALRALLKMDDDPPVVARVWRADGRQMGWTFAVKSLNHDLLR